MKAAIWSVLILLALTGVIAGVARFVEPARLGESSIPLRRTILQSIGRFDARQAAREPVLRTFDRPFAAHPTLARLHVGPGALFLVAALLQFSGTMRRRYPKLHRWSGRVLLLLSVSIAASALFFTLTTPFGGASESVVIVIATALFVVSMTRAYLAIRRGDVERHREWMIRGCAVAFGIASIRIVGSAIDAILGPSDFTEATLFVAALWLGWIVTCGTAEWWIRKTRGKRVPARVTVELEPSS